MKLMWPYLLFVIQVDKLLQETWCLILLVTRTLRSASNDDDGDDED